MNKTRLAIIGFILTPIILSLIFAVAVSVLGVFFLEEEHSKVEIFLAGILGWFFHAILVAYFLVFIIGIPGYLVFDKLGIKSRKLYLFGGFVSGALSPLLSAIIFGVGFVQGIEWWVFTVAALFGLIASATFWQISNGRF